MAKLPENYAKLCEQREYHRKQFLKLDALLKQADREFFIVNQSFTKDQRNVGNYIKES